MRSIVRSAIGMLLGLTMLSVQAADGDSRILRMATTTSTENSGLLRELLPAFQKVSGYEVQVIAVGTGKALRMGREGDVDVVLVHAPGAEKKFVDGGFGIDRKGVMYNDFVIVGPQHDPAAASQGGDATDALRRIAGSGALFVSRGDDSGTHKKERGLWQKAGIVPQGGWYREAGQGMGKVLQMSGELDAYTLTDRGTWLAYMTKSPLKIVSQGDPRLFNPYSIIPVNPKLHPHVNHAGATALSDWITSSAGQELIGRFTINDRHLFTPSANTHSVATK